MSPSTLVTTTATLAVAALLGSYLYRPSLGAAVAVSVFLGSLAVAAVIRREWLLYVLLAFPPGALSWLTAASGMTQILQVGVIVAAMSAYVTGGRRIGASAVFWGQLSLLGVLSANAILGRIEIESGGLGVLLTFAYYMALYVLAVCLAPRDTDATDYLMRIQAAVLVSVLATGVILFFQLEPSFYTTLSVDFYPKSPGLLFNRTHLGYIAALGAAIALPRLAGKSWRSPSWAGLTALMLLLVVAAMTRGGWLSTLLTIAVVAIILRDWWLLVTIPASGLLAGIPGVWQRLSSDFAWGTAYAFQSGSAGSGRVLMWGLLWTTAWEQPLFGHGLGFLTSIPTTLFGGQQFFSEASPFIYAHNDFLYLLIEVGLVGLAPYLIALTAWWIGLAATLRRSLRDGNMMASAALLSSVGIGITLLVAQAVDNAFFVRALFERWMPVMAATTLLFVSPGQEQEREGEAP